MSEALPVIYLARHGETAWTLSGQHTGRTDLPLTPAGERNARQLGQRLIGLRFAAVFTSPLQRAVRTCRLAGFGFMAKVDSDLVEWNYGQFGGLRSAEILAKYPNWDLFRDGCPGGESPTQVAARADRVAKRLRALQADVLLFSSGHFLRVLAARWLGLDSAAGRSLLLSTASLSGFCGSAGDCTIAGPTAPGCTVTDESARSCGRELALALHRRNDVPDRFSMAAGGDRDFKEICAKRSCADKGRMMGHHRPTPSFRPVSAGNY